LKGKGNENLQKNRFRFTALFEQQNKNPQQGKGEKKKAETGGNRIEEKGKSVIKLVYDPERTSKGSAQRNTSSKERPLKKKGI